MLPLLLLLLAAAADSRTWTAQVATEYSFTPAITYRTASDVDLQLDIYAPRNVAGPNSVVIYFHGGGWAGGTRDRAVLRLLPYLEMGFTVVNATYRGAPVAPAPAAIEDCRCALLWVVRNAGKYNFDVRRIVLTGDSAGSHLALMAGLVTPAAGFDQTCSAADGTPFRVGAIVNWFGATDVADLIDGPNARPFANAWIGASPQRAELARKVSPLTYVTGASPAVITIHGDSDRVVPLDHALRLHRALAAQNVRNQLLTVKGGGHGDFTAAQNRANFAAIRAFLAKADLLPRRR